MAIHYTKTVLQRTISYQLTPEEKYLYDQVTNYLTRRKEEATEEAAAPSQEELLAEIRDLLANK